MGGCRVFLCDDDDGYRTLLREVLREDGMEVVGEGGDGRACIEAVGDADPDVVLLDLNMPGMTGLEALPILRRTVRDAKVIVLSTARDAASESAAHILGADGYLSKPVDIFEVPGLLREALAA
jgi:DNA-binding NarL/FixJ family response regulator